MPDDNQTESKVWVRVRALQERGFHRAGRHWTVTPQFAQVTEEQAKQLEAEAMLDATRVSEADVPEAARQAAQQSTELTAVQQAELIKNAEFPLLAAPPGGQQSRTAPPVIPKVAPPAPVNPNVAATKTATEQPEANRDQSLVDPTRTAETAEPESQTTFLGTHTDSRRKR